VVKKDSIQRFFMVNEYKYLSKMYLFEIFHCYVVKKDSINRTIVVLSTLPVDHGEPSTGTMEVSGLLETSSLENEEWEDNEIG
tara:strand:+ start:112 stop:360 length:249 start_codon:yes stop_codon:yes gene_type:complete